MGRTSTVSPCVRPGQPRAILCGVARIGGLDDKEVRQDFLGLGEGPVDDLPVGHLQLPASRV